MFVIEFDCSMFCFCDCDGDGDGDCDCEEMIFMQVPMRSYCVEQSEHADLKCVVQRKRIVSFTLVSRPMLAPQKLNHPKS